MELKKYQKKVINQLQQFLEILNETNNSESAYNKYWNEQGIEVGENGVETYKNTIKNTPHICFKVPTGGGKTFLACSAMKPVFDSMPISKAKIVVWLVPSNAILEQTIKNLKDTNHPYRQRVDVDFNGRVEIYTKEQLLAGQNFNPTSVNEQLSILVLSYDSLRSNRKDGRKIYQENGNLNQFVKFYADPEALIEGIDDTALIQVINQLSPLIIVDESHNATSDLSIEMIVNLNPSFVIDLTATPKDNSNIISYVDAMQLKVEEMVKLPVIVYNRNNQRDVIIDSIDLQNMLEKQACDEEKKTGKYIRPIVLLQAQPKGKENSETFEKLKKELINIGIKEEFIAIKTSEINELKGVDLLSKTCEIRYIITVNALKEGWDCPFAYILATLANKTSRVDVEQILGRVLRQPYAKKSKNDFLNMSYVLTSSNNFRETLGKIVEGLNKAGFSKNDYRIGDKGIDYDGGSILNKVKEESNEQLQASVNTAEEVVENTNPETEEFLDVNFNEVKDLLEIRTTDTSTDEARNSDIETMFKVASDKNQEYENEIQEIVDDMEELPPVDIRGKVKSYNVNDIYEESIKAIKVPQFFVEAETNLFINEKFTLLTKERLCEGFSLKNKESDIDFDTIDNDIVKVDIEGSKQAVPKYTKLSEKDRKYFKEYFSKMPLESKIISCKASMYKQINRIDTVDDTELYDYVNRVVDNMTKDQIDSLEEHVNAYANKIKKKIKKLQEEYMEEQFGKMIELGDIVCRDNYQFRDRISPMKSISTIPKSLYEEEEDMNNFEFKVINEVIALDNIVWWHRNIEKKEFCINGFINHYPDFIVMTKSGKLIIIEVKGDHLENSESKQKIKLGRTWQHQPGNEKYKYYMVFEDKDLNLEGAYQFEKFMNLIKKM